MIDLDLVVLVPGMTAAAVVAVALLAWRRRTRADAVAFLVADSDDETRGVGARPIDSGDADVPHDAQASEARARPESVEGRARPESTEARAGSTPDSPENRDVAQPSRAVSHRPAGSASRGPVSAGIGARSPLRTLLRTTALLLLALAAASPRWSGIPEPSAAERTLVIVLDVSMSMRAADVAPSRLDESKRQVLAALAGTPVGRLALVAFAAAPALVCPPTSDSVAFVDLLSATREDAAQAGPSRASLGLLRALALLQSVPGEVVLVSDGDFSEDDRDRLRDVVLLARKEGVRISTVGVGTEAGAMVPRRDGAPGDAGLDEQGQPMVSRLDAPLLKWLADEGGGEYLPLRPGGDIDLVAAAERGRITGDRTPSHLRPFGPVSLFGYPLLAAIVLLLVEAWLSWRGPRGRQSTPAAASQRRSRVDSRQSGATGIVAGVVGFVASGLLIASPAAGQPDVAAIRRGNAAFSEGRVADATAEYQRALAISPESAIARANLGTALSRAGQLEPAVDALAAAIDGLSDAGHRASAHYNLGNALARLGRYEDALASYRAALRLRDGEDARFNYAVVWRRRDAEGSTGPSPEPPMDPQRLKALRDNARALDVPVVRQPADRRPVTNDR